MCTYIRRIVYVGSAGSSYNASVILVVATML